MRKGTYIRDFPEWKYLCPISEEVADDLLHKYLGQEGRDRLFGLNKAWEEVTEGVAVYNHDGGFLLYTER